MRLQRQLSNASWIDVEPDRIDEFIGYVVQLGIYNFKERRREFVDHAEVLRRLENGAQVKYDNDWYANLRNADALKPRQRTQERQIDCDCGHSVPRSQVMRASRGSSCPDCYDRMSN